MIITRTKPLDDILAKVRRHRSIALIGCGLCATTCRTGGAPEVADMAARLDAEGKTVAWTRVIDGVCQKLLTARILREVTDPEAVLVLACGSGVQTVAALTGVPVYAALDSLYLGSATRLGQFEEKCSLCGSCIVDEFGGFCPVTLCPKGMLNGPCGGMEDGRCETDPERECVWHQIYLKKEVDGRLADLERIVAPRPRHRRSKA